MAILTEQARTAEFLQSEANGYRSRDAGVVTVAANTTVLPGRVMAQITATGKWVPHDADGTDNGTRAPKGILYSALTNGTESAADFDGVVIVRDAEIKGDKVIYDPAGDAAANLADRTALAAFGLIVRTASA
jgi:hypothetical protein